MYSTRPIRSKSYIAKLKYEQSRIKLIYYVIISLLLYCHITRLVMAERGRQSSSSTGTETCELLLFISVAISAKESVVADGGDLQVVDEVTTSSKNEEAVKSSRKSENKDRGTSATSSSLSIPSNSRSEGNYRRERNTENRSNPGKHF